MICINTYKITVPYAPQPMSHTVRPSMSSAPFMPFHLASLVSNVPFKQVIFHSCARDQDTLSIAPESLPIKV